MYITSKSLLSLKALRIANPQGVIAEENPSFLSCIPCTTQIHPSLFIIGTARAELQLREA
jgi:hypothetical protein